MISVQMERMDVSDIHLRSSQTYNKHSRELDFDENSIISVFMGCSIDCAMKDFSDWVREKK